MELIPEHLRDRLFEGVLKGLSENLEKLPHGKKLARKLRILHHDHEFQKDLEAAFAKATNEFVKLHAAVDPEFSRILQSQAGLFENEEIRSTLVVLLKNPEESSDEALVVHVSKFQHYFPGIDADRVLRGITAYLACLAKAAWQLPAFRPVYDLLFNKVIAETAREQLNIARSQLKVSEEIRALLLRDYPVSRVPLPSPALKLSLPDNASLTKTSETAVVQVPDAIDGKAKSNTSQLTENLRTNLEKASQIFLWESTERLGNATPFELQIILAHKIEEFGRAYKNFGNPLLVYEAANALAKSCKVHLPNKPFELGRLHSFLGSLLINSDPEITAIRQARQHLEIAIAIFDGQQIFNRDLIGDFLRASWLHAVSVKIEGDFDAAFELLSDRLNDRYFKKIAGAEEIIPLVRQQAIMEQSEESHQQLREGVEAYRDNAIEYFHTLRRLFEYALNTQSMDSADELYRLSRTVFRKTKKRLDRVYVYTYLKNVYHYLMLKGQRDEAVKLYKRIVSDTQDLNLFGQYRQIMVLAKQFESEPREQVRLKSAAYLKTAGTKL